MKFLLLISLFGIISCGGDFTVDDDGVPGLGGERSFEPLTVTDPNALAAIRSVCESLNYKQSLDLVNYRVNLTYAKKACGASEFIQQPTASYSIRNESGNYLFRDFPIPEVETESAGIMRGICYDLRNNNELTTPLKDESGAAVNFRTLIGSTACDTGPNQVCMLVERGNFNQDETKYTVHTVHTVTFNINRNSGTRGFYTKRQMVTTGLCPQGQVMEQKVTATF